MGMFDYVKSSYPLGEDFSGNCQTKDIEESIGGTMSQYWINPDGQLCLIDYSHTADFVEFKEGDEEYDEKRLWANFQWVPNGTHGKVRAYSITKYVVIYPSETWEGPWEDMPMCRVHFRDGKLQDFKIIRSRRQDLRHSETQDQE